MKHAWLAALLVVSACGYRFTAPGGQLPGGVRFAEAAILENRTAEPGAEVIFTEALRNQLARAAVLSNAPQARIEGSIDQVSGAPLLAPPGRLPTYRLSASATLRLLKNGEELARAGISGDEEYLSGADVLLTEANRQAALKRLAQNLMREGYERLCTGD